MGEPANEYRIQAAVFGDQWIEITFVESRHISDDVVTIQQQLISPSLYPEEITSIMDELGDLLDRSAVHRRNPTFHAVPARSENDPDESD